MSTDIRDLLKAKGPSLTSELIEHMVAQGISASAARQRITRSKNEHKRLAGLRFAKNARFIYLEDQFGRPEFWTAIERAFQSSGISYWGAVVGLRARGGCCPKSMFPAVCGAPLARVRQLSPERILERLSAIQLLEEFKDPETQDAYVRFYPHSYHRDSDARAKALMLAESVALLACRDWARKMGFGSYGKFRLRGDPELPVVSGIAWDMSAPSYLRPLARMHNGSIRPGFFVCDINLNGPITEDLVRLFVRKHSLASAPSNVAPIMPFLVGDVFGQSAFDLARQSGIAATTIENLFGRDTAKALRDLIELLSNSAATAAMNPEHLYKVMDWLTKIEGAANNLRGALFELAVGTLCKDIEGGYLVVGDKRRETQSGQQAEIDVLLNRPNGEPVLVVECKSKIPGASVSLNEVQRWFQDRVPLIHKILEQDGHYNERLFRFELWTNGPLRADAISWLNGQKTNYDGYTIGWKDGSELKKYANQTKSAAIRKILKEHYFLHPLAKLAKAKSPPTTS